MEDFIGRGEVGEGRERRGWREIHGEIVIARMRVDSSVGSEREKCRFGARAFESLRV